MTSKTWYRSWRPTPPEMPPSVVRILAPPLYRVESVSLADPAAARRISNRGLSVSFLCFQNMRLDLVLRSTAEYSRTAISCRPASDAFASVER
ncbi:hypothetical protein IG631_16176 [Alternaria alternata]|nr:hypothetical protein IG631_16176 [Alternaria alternata]